jgi:hypothetical protein
MFDRYQLLKASDPEKAADEWSTAVKTTMGEAVAMLKESWKSHRESFQSCIPSSSTMKPLEGWMETLDFVCNIGRAAVIEWRRISENGCVWLGSPCQKNNENEEKSKTN